ncbi:MAG: DUF1275 domain-containing protein [Actinobacteria bacterium]|uniref:Unannotated protein n=1 Tax=freshwater metagenome TaxID=449393 RepID=A0A6J6A0D2_9ZZZZ|nr:DUF1275 domain-containing protein [Actinomycetota bacterium]
MSAERIEVRGLLAVAVGLALIAGACDGLAYLALDGLFVANQTGNTVLLGLAVARGDGFATLEYLIAIAAFIAGLAAAALLIEQLTRRGFKHVLSASLVIEALLIAFGALIIQQAGGRLSGGGSELLAGASLALAMGMQTSSLQKVGSWAIRTTFVTGLLTDGTLDLVARGLDAAGTSARSAAIPNKRPLRIVALGFGVVAVYAVGALIAGLMFSWEGGKMLFPVAAFTLLLALLTARMPRPALDRRPTQHGQGQP